jgi:hypothetical protein
MCHVIINGQTIDFRLGRANAFYGSVTAYCIAGILAVPLGAGQS